MNILLTDYVKIKSKKNEKDYLKYYMLVDKRILYTGFSECNEMLESFLKNNINEDISEYVGFNYNDNIKGFVPYVKYKL